MTVNNAIAPVSEMKLMTAEEFEFFRGKIFDLAGISLSPVKKELVQSRLRSRILQLGLKNFTDYKDYIESLPPRHDEWESFTNLLTTNKTDWFREAQHFDYLVNDFLPKWKALKKTHLTVWCAASSTGEEPYTLSLVLYHALKGSGITYEVQSTDIDTKVLAVAQNGVYPKDRLDQIPEIYHRGGFSLGTEDISEWMKVKKEIKSNVKFGQFNLTTIPYSWDKKFDLVFCRNVLIYFNQQTIKNVVDAIFECTFNESVLIIAHSESLQNIKTPWKYFRPSIYTKGKVF